MKQIILLRGGQAKENYKSYKDFVTKYEIDPYAEKYIKWSDLLGDTVKNKYKNIDFIEIERFNKLFADYEIRKIVFEKYINFIKNNSIFVAHSLGGTFFLKYFSENNELINKIFKLILVAPAIYDTDEEVLGTFSVKNSLLKLKNYQDKIIVFASKDDPIVKFDEIEYMMKVLPNIDYRIFNNKGHFLQKDFIELINLIELLEK